MLGKQISWGICVLPQSKDFPLAIIVGIQSITVHSPVCRPQEHSISLADLARSEDDSDDANVDMNPLNLYPDPVHFVRFLKSIERDDLSSEIFVRLLESYRELKNEGDDGDPMQ